MKNNALGFTLVEVITVMILISILAITVVSKFSGSDSFEAYTFRSSLISALRLTQQRAMQQTSGIYCHKIVFENKRYGIPSRTDCSLNTFPSGWKPDLTGLDLTDDALERYKVTFKMDNGGTQIEFDDMGRPQQDCFGGCTISIASSVESLKIKIESEGYIHAID